MSKSVEIAQTAVSLSRGPQREERGRRVRVYKFSGKDRHSVSGRLRLWAADINMHVSAGPWFMCR